MPSPLFYINSVEAADGAQTELTFFSYFIPVALLNNSLVLRFVAGFTYIIGIY